MIQKEKRVISLFLSILMLVTLLPQFQLPVAAQTENVVTSNLSGASEISISQEGICGENITWLLSSVGTLTLSGTGIMTDYAAASDIPWYSIRDSIKSVRIGNGITSIGDRAFYNCTALCDVEIGSDVTTVGTYAFRGCTALEAVTIPASVTQLKGSAFRACTALALVRLEGDAPAVENYVFNDGSTSQTLQYYEGSTGYGVSPWTEFIQFPQHIGTWIVTVAPTCTTDGNRYIDCSYCQTIITEVIPAKHQYVEGICTICQEVMVRSSGTFGSNVQWKLDVLGALTISGEGMMQNSTYASFAPWYPYREEIKTITVQNGITSIGDHAFYNCGNLTSVTLPESVTIIDYGAFYKCSSLTAISLPERVTKIGGGAFLGCTNLTTISLPESVTSIGNYAFEDCSSLTSITLPKGVDSINERMFDNCKSLTCITLLGSVTSVGNNAFYGCKNLKEVHITDLTAWCSISFSESSDTPMYYAEELYLGNALLNELTIPDDVPYISDYTFWNCSSITSVVLPESVNSIGDSAFSNCSNLTSITIPESVSSIGSNAFSNCSNLTSITIPESVSSIGSNAFFNCRSLTNITIPGRLTRIEDSVFSGCSSLTSVTISKSVTSIGYYAFGGCNSLTSITLPENLSIIGSSAFSGCSSLANISLPKSMTTIGGYAFYNCISLTSISLPDGITIIGDSTFYNCNSLNRITLPESLLTIGWVAFYNCSSLTNITIPESVTLIRDSAFRGCTSLTTITFLGSAPTIGEYLFDASNRCFENVEAIVYHSCTDATWNRTVKQNYGGTLTWTGHIFSDYIYNQDATCTQDGTMTRYCTECDAKATIAAPNTATGHSYDDGQVKVEATCTQNGDKIYTCSGCGDTYTESIASTGHQYQYGECIKCGAGDASTLSGIITSFGSNTTPVTMCIYEKNSDIALRTLTIKNGIFMIVGLPAGEYKLSFSKQNHVTREYVVTLEGGETVVDAKICLFGDVTGDGRINVADTGKVYAHVKGTAELTDYAFACADVSGDGKINVADTGRIYAHVKGTKELF